MTDITGAADEELVRLYRDGDGSAAEALLERYKGLVASRAGKMHLIGGDRDDLIQEGMIGLFKAVQNYRADNDQHSGFRHFAEICVTRNMYTAIEASLRQKNIPLNTYISIYENAKEEGDEAEERPLIDMLENAMSRSPEEELIDRENTSHLEEELRAQLSPLENEVLNLQILGFSYTQIAGILGKTPKQIDNARNRIRNKLKAAVEPYRQ